MNHPPNEAMARRIHRTFSSLMDEKPDFSKPETWSAVRLKRRVGPALDFAALVEHYVSHLPSELQD